MWGDCWEIKDQIGEKKKFRGPEIFGGGTFWGNAKKGVEKLVGGSKKWWEFFWGSQQFWGENFSGKIFKKKIPRGIPWKIFKNKFRGDFLGGSYRGGQYEGGVRCGRNGA